LADLHPFQKAGIDWLYEHDQTLPLVKMGGGKTIIAATAFTELLDEGVLERVLILAPKRVALLVWPAEFELWDQLDRADLAVAVGTASQRLDAFMGSGARFVALNYENIVWAEKLGLLDGFDGLIEDEVSYLQNPTAERSKSIQRHVKQFKIRTGMTGSPGNIKRLFGMTKAIDRGDRLGRTWTGFRNEHYVHHGLEHWDWREKPGAMDKVLDKISDMTFLVEPKDYEDQLPEIVSTQVRFDLTGHTREVYDEMEHGYAAEIDGKVVIAANAGVRSGKLQQIADGFIYTHQAGMTREWEWMHEEKCDALDERLHSGEPTIVVYKYQASLQFLLSAYPGTPYLGAGVTDRQSERAVNAWNAGETELMFLHPASAAHGLNLQAGGCRLVFFSTPWSLEHYEQTIARLRRQGQRSGQIFVDHIMANDTVDEDIAYAQIYRKQVEDAVLAGVARRMQ